MTEFLDRRDRRVEIKAAPGVVQISGEALAEQIREFPSWCIPGTLEIANERRLQHFDMFRPDSAYLLERNPDLPVFGLFSLHGSE